MDSLILRELTINKFRILKNIKIFFSESYNEITGENGIGKSSILDAIRYMLTERDENGSKLLNVKTITLSNEFESPDIELIIRFQSKEISLKTKNEKWFINNIEQKNKTIYFSSLHEKLNNIKPDDLIFAINPNILKDNLSSAKDTKNKENIKELIVSIANTLSDENSQIISNNEFQDLIFEINDLKRQLSDIKKEIKEKNNSIEHFKKMHSEISNWEITNDVSDFDKLELELKNKKIEYENITSKIDKKEHELKETNIKINEIDNISLNLQSKNYDKKKKPSIGELILMILLFFTIIFGFIYYFFYIKPKYYKFNDEHLVSTELKDLNEKKKLLKNKREKIIDELNYLKNNPNYNDVDFNKIVDELNELKINRYSNDSIKENKIKLSNKLDELNQINIEYENICNELIKKENEKRKVSELTNKIIKKYFPNFDIDLFNQEEKESLIISKDNIPLNYLNHSLKMNLIFEINKFINNKLKINTFMLIDGGESFNKIYNKGQVIVAKVNNESEIKINGKNIC